MLPGLGMVAPSHKKSLGFGPIRLTPVQNIANYRFFACLGGLKLRLVRLPQFEPFIKHMWEMFPDIAHLLPVVIFGGQSLPANKNHLRFALFC
mmetsp:Transcript_14268/g.30979  ORF Transcript_14268/g.30979 Transcript_14268/m.30979 type:complete len:93 (-) Transcript_14268:51-329(-)